MAKPEQAAGRALNEVMQMGLSISEVIEWCAADLTSREVALLRRMATQNRPDTGETSGVVKTGEVTARKDSVHDELLGDVTEALSRGRERALMP